MFDEYTLRVLGFLLVACYIAATLGYLIGGE